MGHGFKRLVAAAAAAGLVALPASGATAIESKRPPVQGSCTAALGFNSMERVEYVFYGTATSYPNEDLAAPAATWVKCSIVDPFSGYEYASSDRALPGAFAATTGFGPGPFEEPYLRWCGSVVYTDGTSIEVCDQ